MEKTRVHNTTAATAAIVTPVKMTTVSRFFLIITLDKIERSINNKKIKIKRYILTLNPSVAPKTAALVPMNIGNCGIGLMAKIDDKFTTTPGQLRRAIRSIPYFVQSTTPF